MFIPILAYAAILGLLRPNTAHAIGENDSLKPFGAVPDEAFTNSVSFDQDTQTFELIFSGTDTIRYAIDVASPEVQNGLVHVAAQINGGPIAYPVTEGGTRYRRHSGEIIEPVEFAATATTMLESSELLNDRVTLTYSDTLDGIANEKTFEFWIEGKTLFLHVTSPATSGLGNYAGFSCGRTDDTSGALQKVLPYTLDPIVIVPDGRFLSCYIDRGKSSSADLELPTEIYFPNSLAASYRSFNIPDSAGFVPPIDETVYVTVSDDVHDVMARPNHLPSPYHDQLSSDLVLHVQSGDTAFPPVVQNYVSRDWVSPANGVANVFGQVSDSAEACGDGVYVRILRNQVQLWARHLTAGDTTGYEFDMQIPVLTGDTLSFRIEPFITDECDWTLFYPTVVLDGEVYDSITDYVGIQGNRGWYYRDCVESTIEDMAWVDDHWQGSSTYSRLDPDSGHPPPNLDFRFYQAPSMFARYKEYGMTNLRIVYTEWQHYGYDTGLPTHFPADATKGGSEGMSTLAQSARDLGFGFCLHENYIDMYPNDPPDYPNPLFDESAIAKHPDLSLVRGWYNENTGEQSYVIACDHAAQIAQQQSAQIEDAYNPDAAYLDVSTAILPSRTIDFDAANPTPRTLAEAIRLHKLLFQQQKVIYGGPLLGEGHDSPARYDTYFAGYVDGVQRSIVGRADAEIVPDFELLAVRPLMVNLGMGHVTTFFPDPSDPHPSVDMDSVDLDRWRALTIAFGHAGYLNEGQMTSPEVHYHFPDYFLLQQLEQRVLKADRVEISYEDNGEMLDLSSALLAGTDFRRSRIAEDYDDHLHVLLNLRDQGVVSSSFSDFGPIQGKGGWYYQEWTGSTYQDLIWDGVYQRWQGSFTYCMIDDSGGHPQEYEPARKWLSPVSTTVHVYGNAHDLGVGCGDGVEVSIYYNDTLYWSAIIEEGDQIGTDFDFDVDVEIGDAIYFRIGERTQNGCDATYFSPTIAYVDPEYEWIVSTPAGEYRLPRMGWIAWDTNDDFLEYSALVDGARSEFVRSPAYVYARARSGNAQVIEHVTTDGAVSLPEGVVAGSRDLHLVAATEATSEDAPYGLIRLSERGDVNVVYQDESTAVLTVRNTTGRKADVTYGDFPQNWRRADGTLERGILVFELNPDGGAFKGNAIPWTSPSGGFDMFLPGLGEGVSYQIRLVGTLGPDPTGPIKGRAISFVSSGDSTVARTGENAIRVTLRSLHHVSPPYTNGTAADFSALEGQVRWVGPPTQYVESVSSGTPFYASQLQCDPHYQDWNTVGLVHVFGSAIVPSSSYEVENVAASCMGSEASCTAVSAPLSISTTRWGDVVDPFNPPSTTSQPDFGDIGALVNKFKSAAGAPIKARALLAGTNANGEIDPTPDLGFTHISACVDAFKGFPYPYQISGCP